MQWEQKWLSGQIKWDTDEQEREEMFLSWNVHRESKQRKLQLIRRIWSPETLRYGLFLSSNFVMSIWAILYGACIRVEISFSKLKHEASQTFSRMQQVFVLLCSNQFMSFPLANLFLQRWLGIFSSVNLFVFVNGSSFLTNSKRGT